MKIRICYWEYQGEKTSQHQMAHRLLEEMLEKEGVNSPFSYGKEKGGKPFLTERPEIKFNISHCPVCVACAVGDVPIGIDVERRFPWKEKLAQRSAHPQEYRDLKALPVQMAQAALGIIWSGKESYLKCIGTGLRRDLRTFRVWFPDMMAESFRQEPLRDRENTDQTEHIFRPWQSNYLCRIDGREWQFGMLQTEEYTLSVCAPPGTEWEIQEKR